MEPSASCVTVVWPLASVFVLLLPMPTVLVPLYLVPLTVTLQSFEAVELILPEEPATSCIFQPTRVVFFSTFWLTIHQLNFKVSHEVTVTDLLPFAAILITYLHQGQIAVAARDERKLSNL